MNRPSPALNRGSTRIKTLLVLSVPGLIFTAVGVYYTSLGIDRIREGWDSRSWPTTAGTVMGSGVAELQSLPPSNRPQDHRFGASYLLQVSVRYQVDGVDYTTHRVSVDGSQYPFEFQARRAADRFPKDAVVDVAHHPERPDLSVLEPGLTPASFFPLLAGVGIAAGIWLLVFLMASAQAKGPGLSPRRRRRSRLP